MKTLTLETLPGAISELAGEVDEIKRLLLFLTDDQSPPSDQWLTLDELCQYHPDKPTKPTVYAWVSARSIPVHRSSKKLRFLKSEIDAWLQQGRKKTQAEIQAEAAAYVNSKTRGGKL